MAQDNSAPPSGTRFDIIVVGGGTIGLSAAYYAAARGSKALLLEQYDRFGDPRASSGGHSRFFRIMHSSAYMARLAEVSLALWQEIETASNEKILKQHPLMFYGVSGKTPEGDLGCMKNILADLAIPYQWYDSGTALQGAFKVFKTVPENYTGLVQPNSAVIRTQKSIAAFHKLAKDAGANLLTNQPAELVPKGGTYEVTCPAGSYSADSLILAPGPWTNSVLRPFDIQLNLCIWQMTVAYFEARTTRFEYPFWYEFGPTMQRTASMMRRMHRTLLEEQTTQQDLFYGFPPDEKPGFIKVSADYTYDFYTDPCHCTYAPCPKILSDLECFLQERFNGATSAPTDLSTCLYTFTKDGQMVLDTLPDCRNVAIFTGDSGRGFKFTPLVGRVLVDLATAGSTDYDISPLSIKRAGIIRT